MPEALHLPEAHFQSLKEALADEYIFEEPIGGGGMGIVCRARDLKHQREVALKILPPDLAAAVGADRFLREIRIEAGLSHPHILPVYDSGEAAGPAMQANGCWQINRYPEGAFDHDVKVEICVADNPTTPLSNTEWNSLVVYQSDPGTVKALPWVSPDENIDCSGFGGAQQTASSSRLRSLLASVGSRVARLILPKPLAARPPFFSHPPMGIGGTAGAFSEFFGAPSGHSVSGTVRYSDHALSGVRVTMNPTDDAADLVEDTTDAAGRYDFRGIVPGDYTVKVYGDGYEYPAGSGEYPFVGWVGQDVQVVDDNVVQDRDLPKNIILSEPANGATVDPNGLTLSWTPNAEAEAGGHYDIQINDTDHWFPTAETGQSTTTSYQVQTALEPGEAYTWQVDALDAQGHEVGYSEMAFEYTLSGGAPVVVNGDFGTGDLTGWDSYGTQNWSAAAVSVGGNWAGQLDAGDGPTGNASCTDANYENFGILQQSFTMQKNHFMELDFQVPAPIDDPTENASCVGFDPTNVTSPVVEGPLVLEPSTARWGWLHASLRLDAASFPWLPDQFTARVTIRNEDNEWTGKNLSVTVDNVQGSS
ncbi:MAG: carboxypeptidase regulatory-like domain-containing protein [Gemmatimonadetes bacterium]|nr:carboxypeptidase regulatory-like domain-containing protein [Gemmatimonadota bacterium]